MHVPSIFKCRAQRDAPPYSVAVLKDRFPGSQTGRGTYGNVVVYNYEATSALRIGNYTSIAANVTFLLGGNHRPDFVTTYPFNRMWEGFDSISGHPREQGRHRGGQRRVDRA